MNGTKLPLCWLLIIQSGLAEYLDSSLSSHYSYNQYRRQDSLDSIRVLDESISNIFTSLPAQVGRARDNAASSTARANRLSLSYGLGVAIGTALTIQVGLDGVDISTLTPQDWFVHAGTAFYGYGFGAPFVLGGPLADADPGCGTAELHDVLVRYPNMMDLSGTVYSVLETATAGADPYSLVETRHLPHVKVYDVSSMMSEMRHGLGCLLDKDAGADLDNSLTRLESLLTERLTLTRGLMDNLEQYISASV